jgi:hypothetical protein
MQPYVTFGGLTIMTGLLAGFAAMLAAVIIGQRKDYPGWLRMKPGGLHWFCYLGSAAFSCLLIWIFVGSARSDADFQMNVAFCLSTAFGFCALYSAYRIYHIQQYALRIRGETLAFEDKSGISRNLPFREFEAFRRTISGYYELRFLDGTIIVIDHGSTVRC